MSFDGKDLICQEYLAIFVNQEKITLTLQNVATELEINFYQFPSQFPGCCDEHYSQLC